MSTKKDLKTGAVFEIELDKGSGFGYVKIIRSADIDPTVRWRDFIVKPYNLYSKKSLKNNFNPAAFQTDDLICFPLLLYFRPPLRGKDSWRYIGMSELTEEDRIVPDYLETGWEIANLDELKKAFEANQTKIYYRKNLQGKLEIAGSFESVKHLGHLPHTYPNAVNRFLSIYWLQKHGVNYLEFYDEFKSPPGPDDPQPFEVLGFGNKMYTDLNLDFLSLPKIVRLKYIP